LFSSAYGTQVDISIVARTPQKLLDMLANDHGLPPVALNNLKIVQGSCTEVSAVKQTLATNRIPASLIIVGVGATPHMQLSLKEPFVMDQPNICEDTSKAILTALRELRREGVISEVQKPTLIGISTTGVSNERDVTLDVNLFYHAALSVPHKDKALMEEVIARASTETGPDAPINGFVFIRPSLLLDGIAKGQTAVRVGWVEHRNAQGAANGSASGPAIGRTIRRADVGLWLYENAIKHTADWRFRCVTLTY
jgi:hypothetical protein